jgi:hypothetical protein
VGGWVGGWVGGEWALRREVWMLCLLSLRAVGGRLLVGQGTRDALLALPAAHIEEQRACAVKKRGGVSEKRGKGE